MEIHTLFLEEIHTYSISLEDNSEIDWCNDKDNSFLSFNLVVPFDERIEKQPIKDGKYDLGNIKLSLPGQKTFEFPVIVPKPEIGKRSILNAHFPLAQPNITLVDVKGEVYDGADEIGFHQNSFNSKDLRLKLALWVPNLRSRVQDESIHELEDLLYEGKRTGSRCFVKSATDHNAIASALIELANGDGGQLLIGVEDYKRQGKVFGLDPDEDRRISQVETSLLTAALQITPTIPIAQPDYLRNVKNQVVARLRVAKATTKYRLISKIKTDTPYSVLTNTSASAIVSGEEQARAVTLHVERDISALELGKWICGLINAQENDALIIVKNLSTESRNLPIIGRVIPTNKKQIEDRLKQELAFVSPRLSFPSVEIGKIDNQDAAIIRLNAKQCPVALYNDQSYLVQDRVLHQLSKSELFHKYMLRASQAQTGSTASGLVRINYASLNARMQPLIDPNNITSEMQYDVQHQCMRWIKLPTLTETSDGFNCELEAPLGQAFVGIGPDTRALEGSIALTFEDTLVSDIAWSIQDQANNLNNNLDQTPFLQISKIPVRRQTHLRINVKINLQELFRRRYSTSLIKLSLPDVSLNEEIALAVQQICADIGFRPYKLASNSKFYKDASFLAVCNRRYHDIRLIVLIQCDRLPIKREIRSARRTDTRDAESNLLNITIWMGSNSTDDKKNDQSSAKQIAIMQADLTQLIYQRLNYQRAE